MAVTYKSNCASIIINVSDQPQSHSNGLSGTWTVPGRVKGEDFAMLIVYPTPEIQDIGDDRRISHDLKARPIAENIVGVKYVGGVAKSVTDAAAHGVGVSGNRQKWGLLLCEAEPQLPRELMDAVESEIEYLNTHRPKVEMEKDEESGALCANNVYKKGVAEQLEKNSALVAKCRAEFERECRRLVTKDEVARAKKNLQAEDQRLVAEGDRMWGRGEQSGERANINELHRNAAARLGQERPWAYEPVQLIDCPGCGKGVKENILSCPHCGGWLDAGVEELRKMHPSERARKMYPERYEKEPVGAAKAAR